MPSARQFGGVLLPAGVTLLRIPAVDIGRQERNDAPEIRGLRGAWSERLPIGLATNSLLRQLRFGRGAVHAHRSGLLEATVLLPVLAVRGRVRDGPPHQAPLSGGHYAMLLGDGPGQASAAWLCPSHRQTGSDLRHVQSRGHVCQVRLQLLQLPWGGQFARALLQDAPLPAQESPDDDAPGGLHGLWPCQSLAGLLRGPNRQHLHRGGVCERVRSGRNRQVQAYEPGRHLDRAQEDPILLQVRQQPN